MSEVNSILASAPINPPPDSRERLSTSRNRKPKKPPKPYPDFPLTAHPTKRWCKKIRGKLHYFGSWDDPHGALKKYLEQRDDLHAGRTPRQTEGFTVRDLCNRFMTAKKHALDIRELSPRTFSENFRVCEHICRVFGKDTLVESLRPDDFSRFKMRMPASWGPIFRGKMVQGVRTIFKFAFDQDLIEKPVKFGSEFKRPSKKTLRLHRAAQGKRMFDRDEIHRMLDAAGPVLKAMILLGVNAGYGNSDVAALPLSALDLEQAWADFPRPKTGIERRCKLFPETVAAIRAALTVRPKPKDEANAGLVFLTAQNGNRWVTAKIHKKEDGGLRVVTDDSVSKETAKILKRLGINGKRNFYALRHTFETIGGESRDQVAVSSIMGHADQSMSAAYRERISDERLAAVAEHVRRWLFGDTISIQGKAE
jgi:integrase